MPTLIENFNYGSAVRNDNPELARQLQEAYSIIAYCVNTKVSVNVTTIDPPGPATPDTVNQNYNVGDEWVNTDSDTAWKMTSRTSDLLATWTQTT